MPDILHVNQDFYQIVFSIMNGIKCLKRKTGSASREDWPGYAGYTKFYPVHPADASSILLILSFSMNKACSL
jgi:hypothetical protein